MVATEGAPGYLLPFQNIFKPTSSDYQSPLMCVNWYFSPVEIKRTNTSIPAVWHVRGVNKIASTFDNLKKAFAV
jgi:hypothetical protein